MRLCTRVCTCVCVRVHGVHKCLCVILAQQVPVCSSDDESMYSAFAWSPVVTQENKIPIPVTLLV